jgi:hypothetical protein
LALGAALLLLLPAGCGRSEGEEFREDSLRPVEQRLDRERARVAATLRVVRPGNRRDARALGEDIDVVARSVRRVAGLVPPREAAESFDAFADALRALVAELRRLQAALRRGDSAVLATASQRVQDATGRVQQRREQLEAALLAV